MDGDVDLSVPARAMGEPARGRMLTALLAGLPLPAGHLARAAGVAPSTASEHLRVLVNAGLLTVTASGRHRHYALAGADVARAVEALQAIAPTTRVNSLRQHRVAADLRAGRSCYDHLAGDLGLRVTALLLASGVLPGLEVGGVTTLTVPLPAHPLVDGFDLPALTDQADAARTRRPLVRGCLDWTGRRPHVAGRLGSHLLTTFRARDWVRPRPGSRSLALTDEGQRVLLRFEAAHAGGESGGE